MLSLEELIKEDKADLFYNRAVWKRKREEVLKLDRFECQVCKAKGKYSKGEIVHHIKHLKDYPELALSIYDGEERQLITVCKKCHEELHPESQRQTAKVEKESVTEERWD